VPAKVVVAYQQIVESSSIMEELGTHENFNQYPDIHILEMK
jgi:hypothetical protein